MVKVVMVDFSAFQYALALIPFGVLMVAMHIDTKKKTKKIKKNDEKKSV